MDEQNDTGHISVTSKSNKTLLRNIRGRKLSKNETVGDCKKKERSNLTGLNNETEVI